MLISERNFPVCPYCRQAYDKTIPLLKIVEKRNGVTTTKLQCCKAIAS